MIRMALSLWAGILGIFLISSAAQAQVLADGIYQFKEDASTTSGVHFVKGEAVHLQVRGDAATLTFQLDQVEEGDSDQTRISSQEAAQLPLELSALASKNEFHAFANPQKRGGRTRLHYMGATGCVAYVLRAIGWRGGRSGNGWEVTRTLRKMGWHSASCSNPSYGTVASWTGGHTGAGHTAIWQGCWAYDLACADPGHLYHMIDCVHR